MLDELRSAIGAALPTASSERIAFEVPPNSLLGDVAVPCFALAKALRQSPAEIAARIAEALGAHPLVAKAAVVGPYVNVTLDAAEVAKRTLAAVAEQGKRYGNALPSPSPDAPAGTGRSPSTAAEGENVVLEFISPNTNKPLHLGHLRNAFLGEAIARLLEAQGHAVRRVCLVNDRGVHIMKSMLAYHRWGQGTTPESEGLKGDHFVGNWYVAFDQKNRAQRKELALADDQRTPLEEEIAELLRRWEAGDAEIRALWERMNAWALAGLRETYARIGIAFDREYLESATYERGRAAVHAALAAGTLHRDARGHTVARLAPFGLPDKVLERADGTTVYATQDIALALAKEDDNHPDRSIIVTGNEQDLYFKQLFAIFELLWDGGVMGFGSQSAASDETSGEKGSARPRARSEQATRAEGKGPRENREVVPRMVHKSYGMVELPEGKMKSREGTVVDADDLIAELTRLAEEEIRKRADAVPGEPTAGTDEPPIVVSDAALARAKDIALAAVKFYLLLVTPETTVTFDPKASLAFTGKTGPYLQYMHARICSIQRRAEASGVSSQRTGSDADLLTEASEKQLLLCIARFPDVVAAAADHLDPSTLAQFLYDFAKTFADFYRDVPVLKANADVRAARLALIGAARLVLARGLTILGIAPLEAM